MRATPVLLGGGETGLRPPAAEPPTLDALSFLACLELATSPLRSCAAAGALAGGSAGRAATSDDGQPEESAGDGSGGIQPAAGTAIAAQIAAVLAAGVPAPAVVVGEPAGLDAPAVPGAAPVASPSGVAAVASAGAVQVAAVGGPHEAGASGAPADVPAQPQATPPTGATGFVGPPVHPTDQGRSLAEVAGTRVRRSSAGAVPARTDGAGRLAEAILAGERRPSPGAPAASPAPSPSAAPAGASAQPAVSHSPAVGLAGPALAPARPESPPADDADPGAGPARGEGPAMGSAARRSGADGAPEEAPGSTVPRRSAEVREAPESAASGVAASPAATPATREARPEPGDAVPPAGGSPQPPRATGVGEQIVAHAHLFSTARGRGVRMHLRPPELGDLDVRLVVESGQVTLHVATDTASTRGLIESAWPALRESLAERGLHAQRLVVEHGISGDATGASASSGGHDEPPPHQPRHAYRQDVAARDAPATSRPRPVAGDPGRSGGLIDYRI